MGEQGSFDPYDPEMIAQAAEHALMMGTGESGGEVFYHPEPGPHGGLWDMHNLPDECFCGCVVSGEPLRECIPVDLTAEMLSCLAKMYG